MKRYRILKELNNNNNEEIIKKQQKKNPSSKKNKIKLEIITQVQFYH